MKSTYKKKYLSEILSRTVILHPLTQYELAEKIGVHPSTFNRAIHGSPVSVSDTRWLKLAEVVRIPKHKIFE